MRYLFALLSLLLSFFLAYIRSYSLYSGVKANEFFLDLAYGLLDNAHRRMLPFSDVFTEVYLKHFSEDPNVKDAYEASVFIKDKLNNASGFSEINELINKQFSASENDIDEVLTKLIKVTERSLECAKEKNKKNGKPSFVLYPSAVLMLILLLA